MFQILIAFLQLGVLSLQLRNYVDDISILILLAELVDPGQFLLIVAGLYNIAICISQHRTQLRLLQLKAHFPAQTYSIISYIGGNLL